MRIAARARLLHRQFVMSRSIIGATLAVASVAAAKPPASPPVACGIVGKLARWPRKGEVDCPRVVGWCIPNPIPKDSAPTAAH